MSGFRARDARVFRPYPDEVPWDLLESVALDGRALREALELNLVRVAKYEDRVIGAYGIRPLESTVYELVGLVVAEGYRRKGLGSWLLGHAIGLAESRGAREILVRGAAQPARGAFLASAGFIDAGGELRLTLMPE